MNDRRYDAIVVGARCAGSPAAMLLARGGYRVLLLDRARFPSDTVSTHLIHAPGVAALDRQGLLDPAGGHRVPGHQHLLFRLRAAHHQRNATAGRRHRGSVLPAAHRARQAADRRGGRGRGLDTGRLHCRRADHRGRHRRGHPRPRPQRAARELRLSRLGVFDAGLGAIRADTEAAAARKVGDHACAGRHETLAASYRALRDHYQQREQIFARALAERQEWEHTTELKQFENRGHSLTIDSGWKEIAEAVLQWLHTQGA